MSKITFVSGGDANYFPILLEWLHSVRRFEQSKHMDINILDAGLTEKQKTILKPHVQSIVNPDWPVKIGAHKIRGREYLKACVCRPFLPDIFPGYDVYFWMDADTWVQTWRSIELYIEGAKRGKLAITAQVDRGYYRNFRIKWLGPWPWKVRGFYFSNALKAFGLQTAKKLLPFNVLNAGSFALPGNAPHWKRWQELVIQAQKKGKVFTAEQLTLGMLVYLENHPAEILPAWTQWLTESKPVWNKKQQLFVEPFLPHEPVGIMHISGYDDMRLDRSIHTDIPNMKGEKENRSLRYPHFDGEKDTLPLWEKMFA